MHFNSHLKAHLLPKKQSNVGDHSPERPPNVETHRIQPEESS